MLKLGMKRDEVIVIIDRATGKELGRLGIEKALDHNIRIQLTGDDLIFERRKRDENTQKNGNAARR